MKRLKKFGWFIALIIISAVTKAQTFSNSILSGFYPNPIICKAGNDYHIVNSSFAYYPGLPVFHSKYLLNWQQPAIQLLNITGNNKIFQGIKYKMLFYDTIQI